MNATTCEKLLALTTRCELEQLEAHLQACLCSQVLNLELSVRDGGLMLRGRARTYHAKQLAQHAAMKGTRLRILANDIEVK
jgi:hypothetical protein